jgi:hypothetical protein
MQSPSRTAPMLCLFASRLLKSNKLTSIYHTPGQQLLSGFRLGILEEHFGAMADSNSEEYCVQVINQRHVCRVVQIY